MTYVLMVVDDGATLITSEGWNEISIDEKQKIISESATVIQTDNNKKPENDEELFEIIKKGIKITSPLEEIF